MIKQDNTQYYFVYRDIIMNIYAGKYRKGDLLPSLNEFCEIYDIGRNTARSALRLLKENGYIEQEERKKPVVIFNLDNSEYRTKYLTELAERKAAINHVFEFMEYTLPDIFTVIVAQVPEPVRLQIAGMARGCGENFSVRSEQEIFEGISQLCRIAISLSNNELLEQLFLALFRFVQVPLCEDDRHGVAFKAAVPFLKNTFKKFQKQIEAKDYEAIRCQIRFLLQTEQKNSSRYLNRICESVQTKTKEEFFWMIPSSLEREYMALAAELIGDIGRGTYKTGVILPSYAQLAALAQVSEKTSRSAVDVLKQLKVVSTFNGIGTKVNAVDVECMAYLLKHEQTIVSEFFEAVQVLQMIGSCMTIWSLGTLTDEDVELLKNKVKQDSQMDFRNFMDILFYSIRNSATKNVYFKLRRRLQWGYLLDYGINREVVCLDRDILLDMLERKNYDAVGDKIFRVLNRYFQATTELATKYGMIITVPIRFFTESSEKR